MEDFHAKVSPEGMRLQANGSWQLWDALAKTRTMHGQSPRIERVFIERSSIITGIWISYQESGPEGGLIQELIARDGSRHVLQRRPVMKAGRRDCTCTVEVTKGGGIAVDTNVNCGIHGVDEARARPWAGD